MLSKHLSVLSGFDVLWGNFVYNIKQHCSVYTFIAITLCWLVFFFLILKADSIVQHLITRGRNNVGSREMHSKTQMLYRWSPDRIMRTAQVCK